MAGASGRAPTVPLHGRPLSAQTPLSCLLSWVSPAPVLPSLPAQVHVLFPPKTDAPPPAPALPGRGARRFRTMESCPPGPPAGLRQAWRSHFSKVSSPDPQSPPFCSQDQPLPHRDGMTKGRTRQLAQTALLRHLAKVNRPARLWKLLPLSKRTPNPTLTWV